MEPLAFFFDEIDNAPSSDAASDFESKVVGILRQYLRTEEDRLSLARATQSIISFLPEPCEPRGWSEELTAFWELCITAAGQIPHYHVCQVKLARLILALRYSPKTAFTVIWDKSNDIRYTLELNLFRETVREKYNPAFSVEDREATSTPEHGKRWINTSAFYAHMHALNGGMLSLYCTWAMRDAFESTPSTHYAALDCHVSAATQWILHSGQTILGAILVPLEDENGILGPGEPWTLEDWRRWQAGFRTAENEENLQHGTRQLAKKSADLMETLEAVMIRT